MTTTAKTQSDGCATCPVHNAAALRKLGVDMTDFDFVVAQLFCDGRFSFTSGLPHGPSLRLGGKFLSKCQKESQADFHSLPVHH